MSDDKKDLYPDLGLKDIIEILNKKDRERLNKAVYSTEGVEVVSDLSYKNDGDFYHDFDIYYGKSSGESLPTVLCVHGGGLVYGTKDLNKQMGIYLAKLGFNLVNINYRLLPDVTIKDQITDLADSFAYIYESAYKLNLNSEKFYLISDSAGSFLSLAAFALMKDRSFREIFALSAKDFNLSAMAFISPMTGLVKTGSLSLINEPARRSLSEKEIPFTENILRAFKNTSLPPSLIVTSEEDFIRNQALDFKNFLDNNGIQNKFLDFKKSSDHPLGHGFAVSHPDLTESKIVLEEISNFFNKF